MPYTPNFMNPRYSMAPQMPGHYGPSATNIFLSHFTNSLMDIFQQKMRHQMDMEAYGKKMRMEEEWKREHPTQEELFKKKRFDYLSELEQSDPEAYRLTMLHGGRLPDWYGRPEKPPTAEEELYEWAMGKIRSGPGGGMGSQVGDETGLAYDLLKSKTSQGIADYLFPGHRDSVEASKQEDLARSRAASLDAAQISAVSEGAFPRSVVHGKYAHDFSKQSGDFTKILEEYQRMGIDPGIAPTGTAASLTTRGLQKIAESAAHGSTLPQEVGRQREWWKRKTDEEKQSEARRTMVENWKLRKEFEDKNKGAKAPSFIKNPEGDAALKRDVFSLLLDIADQTPMKDEKGVTLTDANSRPIMGWELKANFADTDQGNKNELKRIVAGRLNKIKEDLLARNATPEQVKVYFDEFFDMVKNGTEAKIDLRKLFE